MVSKTFASSQLCMKFEFKNKNVENLTIHYLDCSTCGMHYDRNQYEVSRFVNPRNSNEYKIIISI
ncbi:TPA: hypothetical protein QCY38_004859 [Bacillus toyonensis]|nr:hypothetical protein [Bacillus toyonensis]